MDAEYKLYQLEKMIRKALKELEVDQMDMTHYTKGKIKAYKNVLEYLED